MILRRIRGVEELDAQLRKTTENVAGLFIRVGKISLRQFGSLEFKSIELEVKVIEGDESKASQTNKVELPGRLVVLEGSHEYHVSH